MKDRTDYKNFKNILELIYLEGGKIRLRLYKSQGDSTVRFYQENRIDRDRINDSIKETRHFLNMINTVKNNDPDLFAQFQKSCQVLYHELLNTEIILSLQDILGKNLELVIDDQLLDIPWELLFDGEKFLCEQFNTGRNIMTRGKDLINKEATDKMRHPLKMLIIADPTGDLKIAFEEGCQIFNEFKNEGALIDLTFHSSEMVCLDFLKKNVMDFDIVHFAGHVEYDFKVPDRTAWILSDGRFSVKDIVKMVNSKITMPSLVFSNACRSGSIRGNFKRKAPGEIPYTDEGFVHAFIKAGVKYYIGTFSKVSDEYGAYMGLEFYRHLLQGNMIGESLRKARESFRESFGRESFSWLNYMLYGDPAGYLVKMRKEMAFAGKNEMKKSVDTGGHSKKSFLMDRSHTPSLDFMHHTTRGRSIFTLRAKWTGRLILFIFFFAAVLASAFIIHRAGELKHKGYESSKGKKERIEELKNSIYEKLKVREAIDVSAKGGSITRLSGPAMDNWTSEPITIAIFDLFNKYDHPPGWSIRKIGDLYRGLTKLFANDKRIWIVEREELDKLLEEKELVLSDLPLNSVEDRRLFGGFLYASIMLFLEGYRSSDGGIYLCYKLVDVKKGEIFKANPDIRLTKTMVPSDLVMEIFPQIKGEIHLKYPLRGRIKSIKGGAAVINIGSDVGVKEGDFFEVLDPHIGKEKKRRIGMIKVIDRALEKKSALCEILDGVDLSGDLRIEFLEDRI